MPTTDFHQEEKTNQGVADFITGKNVKFTVLELGHVNGSNESPLYTELKAATSSGKISWNFSSYFLIDRSGMKVSRFDGVSPLGLEGEIDNLLGHRDTASL